MRQPREMCISVPALGQRTRPVRVHTVHRDPVFLEGCRGAGPSHLVVGHPHWEYGHWGVGIRPEGCVLRPDSDPQAGRRGAVFISWGCTLFLTQPPPPDPQARNLSWRQSPCLSTRPPLCSLSWRVTGQVCVSPLLGQCLLSPC